MISTRDIDREYAPYPIGTESFVGENHILRRNTYALWNA
jgi:hypothetical protein